MSDLTTKTPAATYKSLLKISNTDNEVLDEDLKSVEDGLGTDSKLQLSTGAVNIDGVNNFYLNGAQVTASAVELNALDAETGVSAVTLIDGDNLVVNDSGTLKKVALSSFKTYFEGALILTNNITNVGILNSGSINTGFGSIDTGASSIATTGKITGGRLDIDDVEINGTTIGHTSDTDLMTLASAQLVVKGKLCVSDETATFNGGDYQLQVGDGGTYGGRILLFKDEDDGAILATNVMGSIVFGGTENDGSNYGEVAEIRVEAAEAFTEGSAEGSNMFFLTTPNTTASKSKAMTILHSGNVGIGTSLVNPTGQLHVDQASASGAKPVLTLDQGDPSEEMMEFLCTIGTGNAIEAVGAKSLTTTHFIKVTIQGGLTRYIPVGTIA